MTNGVLGLCGGADVIGASGCSGWAWRLGFRTLCRQRTANKLAAEASRATNRPFPPPEIPDGRDGTSGPPRLRLWGHGRGSPVELELAPIRRRRPLASCYDGAVRRRRWRRGARRRAAPAVAAETRPTCLRLGLDLDFQPSRVSGPRGHAPPRSGHVGGATCQGERRNEKGKGKARITYAQPCSVCLRLAVEQPSRILLIFRGPLAGTTACRLVLAARDSLARRTAPTPPTRAFPPKSQSHSLVE